MSGAPAQAAGYAIRLARAEQVDLLRAIEYAAQQRFRAIGRADLASGEPTAAAILAADIAAGRCLVAVDRSEVPVGFLAWSALDGRLYVRELSVAPEHGRRRLGARLLDAAGGEASRRGLSGLTLTTFRAAPWNAPYYLRLGFAFMAAAEIGPELRAEIARLHALGLDEAERAAMFRSPGARAPDDMVNETLSP